MVCVSPTGSRTIGVAAGPLCTAGPSNATGRIYGSRSARRTRAWWEALGVLGRDCTLLALVSPTICGTESQFSQWYFKR